MIRDRDTSLRSLKIVCSLWLFISIRFILSIQNNRDTPLWSPVISENTGDHSNVSPLEIRSETSFIISGYAYADMIPQNVLMREIRHMPKECSNKRIGIWACGNVDTYSSDNSMRQTWNKATMEIPYLLGRRYIRFIMISCLYLDNEYLSKYFILIASVWLNTLAGAQYCHQSRNSRKMWCSNGADAYQDR